ncbi:hypothetical protein DFS34DRAFT_652070 [Phlyctochytrium arcticum]|nr:hypothetical protein DFS34DRAFT_652070 [Phlyctochytrium arcticum]
MIPVLMPFGWAASSYLYWVRGKRHDTLTEILQGPDPQASPEAAFVTYEKTWEYEFPFLSRMAFHFGMIKAFAIPSIAKSIASSKKDDADFARGTEDTDLLVREMTERPLTHPRAQQAMERARAIRSMYRLTNDEYCYVLSVLVVEPCRLVERWGYRSLAPREKEAHFEVWKAIGTHMGIQNIPASFEEMEEFAQAFEAKHSGSSASSAELAAAAIDLFIDTLPFKSAHPYILPLARRLIHSLMDPALRSALRISAPPIVLAWTAEAMMRLHSGFVKFLLPPREEPCRRTPEIASGPSGRIVPVTNVYGEFYTHGYRIKDLGPKSSSDSILTPAATMAKNVGDALRMRSLKHHLSAPRLSMPGQFSWQPIAPAEPGDADTAVETHKEGTVHSRELRGRQSSTLKRRSLQSIRDRWKDDSLGDAELDEPVLFKRHDLLPVERGRKRER